MRSTREMLLKDVRQTHDSIKEILSNKSSMKQIELNPEIVLKVLQEFSEILTYLLEAQKIEDQQYNDLDCPGCGCDV